MPMDPQWNYRFTLRKKYPQDNYGHTRLMMKAMLEEQSVFINVVTFPAPGLREDEEILVAVAVWQVNFNSDRDYSFAPTGSAGSRRDANFEHTKAFDDYLSTAKKSSSDSTYQSHQLHLRILATHPDLQRKGAGDGALQMGDGAGKAAPRARFAYIGTVTIQVEGEKEKLSVGAMVYVSKSA
ncbi:Acyl-CoA N-acyltransferase [Akanthomyces lecanii RCEF 1005]|uniref:Acyl-CoA N-acyltransferase n=1 Tax=Akanthomyces lecanii RCEF 1005 TaxID=1081108 RepID=A0A162KR80_CORDF|nr:Acyl-CoA N-acyltransferase [Akanthomyces lecanii RCEF 1005]